MLAIKRLVLVFALALSLSACSDDADYTASVPSSPAPARSAEIHTSESKVAGGYEDLIAFFGSSAVHGLPGFGKVRVNEKTHEITVYWKGEPPTKVLDAIGVAPDGSRTSWTLALHSRNEIEAAQRRVMEEVKRVTGSYSATVSATDDLGGLILTTESPVDGNFEGVAGMPVEQVLGGVPVDLGVG